MAARAQALNQSFLLPRHENRDSDVSADGARADHPLAELSQCLFQRRFLNLFKLLRKRRALASAQRPKPPQTRPALGGQRALHQLQTRNGAVAVIGVDALNDLRLKMPDLDGDGTVDTHHQRRAAAPAAPGVVTGSPWKYELFRRRIFGKLGPCNLRPMRQHMRFREAAFGKGGARDRTDPRTDRRRIVAPRRDAMTEDAVHARIVTRNRRARELTGRAIPRDD